MIKVLDNLNKNHPEEGELLISLKKTSKVTVDYN